MSDLGGIMNTTPNRAATMGGSEFIIAEGIQAHVGGRDAVEEMDECAGWRARACDLSDPEVPLCCWLGHAGQPGFARSPHSDPNQNHLPHETFEGLFPFLL